MAPAPYHAMFRAQDLPRPVRHAREKQSDHPLMQAWTGTRICQSFARDPLRDKVVCAYAGLVKELDDQLGRLFAYLRAAGRMEDTLIVFCSDHGDNLGDHWLGEKDLFYDCAARVPLIVCDPRPEADATRGTASVALVEAIDIAPTMLDFAGVAPKPHILEGRSLTPLLHGTAVEWRDHVISEYDYATRDARRAAGVDQADARLTMVFDGRWKYIHAETFRPMLFDLQADPDELNDLGGDPDFADQIARLGALHFAWARRHHSRITRSPENIEKMADVREPPGILIAYRDEKELVEDGLTMPGHVKPKT